MNETVDVVVLKEKALQFQEALQLGNVRWPDDVIEANVLEGDLLDSLLEIRVIEDFESVAVDEQLVVTFNLRVAGLDETFGPRLFSPFVAIESEASDSFHLVLPLLANDLEEALRRDVFLSWVSSLSSGVVCIGYVGVLIGVDVVIVIGS